MAGGMTRRPGSVPMTERVARSAARPEPLAKHCWVVDPPGDDGKWPGVVLAWQRSGDGWLGQVAYAVNDDGARSSLVVRWLPSAYLDPVQ